MGIRTAISSRLVGALEKAAEPVRAAERCLIEEISRNPYLGVEWGKPYRSTMGYGTSTKRVSRLGGAHPSPQQALSLLHARETDTLPAQLSHAASSLRGDIWLDQLGSYCAGRVTFYSPETVRQKDGWWYPKGGEKHRFSIGDRKPGEIIPLDSIGDPELHRYLTSRSPEEWQGKAPPLYLEVPLMCAPLRLDTKAREGYVLRAHPGLHGLSLPVRPQEDATALAQALGIALPPAGSVVAHKLYGRISAMGKPYAGEK